MQKIVIKLTDEQLALVKLTASAIDAKTANKVIAAMDERESVEVDLGLLEPDGDVNQMAIALGLLAFGTVGKELNL